MVWKKGHLPWRNPHFKISGSFCSSICRSFFFQKFENLQTFLKVMFAEDCRKFWGQPLTSQCLVFVATWQLRFFWGNIHVGQFPVAPFCLVHIIVFSFCACLRVAASLFCRTCVPWLRALRTCLASKPWYGPPNLDPILDLVLFLFVYMLSEHWSEFWSELGMQCWSVDFGLNWLALVWGQIRFEVLVWVLVWDWSASCPKRCFAGVLVVSLIRIWSVFSQNLFENLVWNFGLNVVWVPWTVWKHVLILVLTLACAWFPASSRFVRGKNWHKPFTPGICQIWH